MTPKSIIIADRNLQAAVAQRGATFNAAGNKIISRYVRLVESRRSAIRRSFSDRELQALLDACNGTIHDPIEMGIAALAYGVADALELDGLAEKRGVDGPNLLAKLRDSDPVTRLALIDFVERARHVEDDHWFSLLV